MGSGGGPVAVMLLNAIGLTPLLANATTPTPPAVCCAALPSTPLSVHADGSADPSAQIFQRRVVGLTPIACSRIQYGVPAAIPVLKSGRIATLSGLCVSWTT